MKWGRIFIGGYVEPMRPVYQVNEGLMRRIAEAKQRLHDRHIEPLPVLRVRSTRQAPHMAK